MSFNRLGEQLQQRRGEHLFRVRRLVESAQGPELIVEGKKYLAFCSNDYLGLANHPEVINAFQQAANEFGVGGGASHLVCGHHKEHHALEEELAEFLNRPKALLFSTGYMANMGVMNALLSKKDEIFQDKWNHASLLDGGLLSGAKFQRFLHNDMTSLHKKLSAAKGERKLIAVDGVFSMDGDLAKLPEICSEAKQHDAWVMVDDAHGFGCVGKEGRGVLDHFKLSVDDVPIHMCTLGKGAGSFGAVVTGSDDLIETLVQFSRTYIYTTALPPAVAAATRASVRLMQTENWRQQKLNQLIEQFRLGATQLGLPLMDSPTAIQPLLIGDSATALRISEKLEEQGILISAIRPPTVPPNTARLRITLSAAHESEQIERLLSTLHRVCVQEGVLNDG